MKNDFDNSVYASEEEFVDYTNEREKCTVMSIKSNSKDITLDTVLLAANAFSVGVGVLGTAIFGKRFIEFCCEKSEFSAKKGITTVLYGIPVALSGTQVILGIKSFKNRKNELQKDLTYRKTLVKRLEKISNKNYPNDAE